MHLAQELVASQEHLASLPTIYYKVRESLADPQISINSLAEIISQDTAIAATLLRVANSAFYGFPRKIETVSRAISLIGLEQVGDIVLAATLSSVFHGIRPQRMNMARFWRGSMRRALLCRIFARHLRDRGDAERMFVVGLLSDVGHLIMYQAVPDLMGIVLDMDFASINELANRERAVIGCDFAEVGAALCVAWRLPVVIGTIIGAQLCPAMAGELAHDAAALNLAISVAEAQEHGDAISAACEMLDPDAPEISGVDLALLPILAEQGEAQLESVISSLGLA